MPSSRAAVLADHIEAAIADGAIPPGARLGTKEELRRSHDVAYGTLNEALRILHQRGYVTPAAACLPPSRRRTSASVS